MDRIFTIINTRRNTIVERLAAPSHDAAIMRYADAIGASLLDLECDSEFAHIGVAPELTLSEARRLVTSPASYDTLVKAYQGGRLVKTHAWAAGSLYDVDAVVRLLDRGYLVKLGMSYLDGLAGDILEWEASEFRDSLSNFDTSDEEAA